jgi:hypothetical protein
MPSIAERLKKLESVDDSGLMMGYRFLINPRRARHRDRTMSKKAVAKKYKASGTLRKIARKPVSKKS